MKSVGIIGLGSMGCALAARLLDQGFKVTGFDVAPESLRRAVALGLKPAADALEVVTRSAQIVLSLPSETEVLELARNAPMRRRGRTRAVVIDTSTISPTHSRAAAALFETQGYGYLDTPVSGGPTGAASGALAMMIGGSRDDLARAAPVLDALAARQFHIGGHGAGSVAKLLNNLLLASNLLTVGEAIGAADRMGVNPRSLVEAVSACSGRSGVTEVNAPRWILSQALDSGFSMALMRKDLRLAGDMLQQAGVCAPVSRDILARWADSAGSIADSADFNAMAVRSAEGARA